MTCRDALRRHQASAAPPPEREEIPAAVKDRVEYQIGYRLGWHHAMEDAIEIAEGVEDD